MDEQQIRLRQYADQQRWLLRATQQIADSANLTELLPQILDDIVYALDVDCVRMVVAPPGVRAYTFGRGPLATRGAGLDSPVFERVQERGAFRWVDGDTAPFDLNFILPTFTALVAMPLRARNMLYGVLWLGFEQPRVLAEPDYTLVAILAGQIATAIANARSFVAVRQRHEWLAAVLAHTPDPVLVVDRDLCLQLANPAAQQLFASLDQDVIGEPLETIAELRDLIMLFDAPDVPLAAQDTDETPLEFTFGDERIYAPSISDVITEHDETAGWVLVLQDVTRFKRLHDNMTEFLSTVSHDMRSPLTFMKGYLDMLDMVGPLNEKQDLFVEKIRTGFQQITDMVEKILKAGRLDPMTGTYRLEREACDLVVELDEVVNGLKGPAHEKGLELHYATNDHIPVLNLDRDLITSAFMNLAENAVKYTPEGGRIQIELVVQGDDVVFRVADDGYGISEADQEKLFRRNVRIHRKEWKRVKGSGLGLFIVKNVAQRHGGDTWVESVEGEGSTFYFSIPLAGANLLGGASREGAVAQAE